MPIEKLTPKEREEQIDKLDREIRTAVMKFQHYNYNSPLPLFDPREGERLSLSPLGELHYKTKDRREVGVPSALAGDKFGFERVSSSIRESLSRQGFR